MPNSLVAIVGRPNVGKSTLFNRLVSSRVAIVTDVPGTTRDRLMAEVSWQDRKFTLVDTGGLEPTPSGDLGSEIKAQVEAAVGEADLIVFLVDVGDGLTPGDRDIADWLRRTEKPLILAVNKVDNPSREVSAAEFHQLGLEEPLLISAYHNLGVHDLLAKIVSLLPVSKGDEEQDQDVMKLAIVGRTNVGKSMLMNTILGQKRSIVSEVPGTTRDALDTQFTYDGRPVILIDTAGIRRRGKVERGVEYYSVLRAGRAVERCDVALLVLDASELATAQDAHVSSYAWDGYRGIIVVVNKWDLITNEYGTEKKEAIHTIRRRFHFMPYVPICFVSALKGQGIEGLMSLAREVYEERLKRVSARDLSYVLTSALAARMPASRKGKRARIEAVRQVDVNPPTFVFSVKNPENVHFSYERYLENRLRSDLGFAHTHLRLVFKGRK